MRIIEMTATFGTLEKAVLRPGPGFTLIQAPNESGKSTWAAFLRAMLYGFPARDRDKPGYLAEKNRYQPWSGAAMEGSLTLEWKGRELTIRRGPKGSAPWGAFSAVWTATQEPVEGLTPETCGEVLLGVSREVFERTAFVGQGSIFLSPSADLEKRVHALATSGEEEVSSSQVERRLKDWLNRRKVNSRVGLIPELEGQLSQADAALERQGTLLRQAQAAQREREELDKRREELEGQWKAHTAADRARQAERRQQAQADHDALLAQVRALEAAAQALPPANALRQAQGDLAYLNTLAANEKLAEKAIPEAREKAQTARGEIERDPRFAGMDADRAAAKAQRDYDEAQSLGRKAFDPLLLFLLPLLVSAALPVWLYFRPRDPFTSFPWWSALMYTLPIVWLVSVLAILPLFFLRRSRQKRAAALLSRYEAQSPDDILVLAAAYGKKCAAAQDAERELRSVEAERAKLAAQQEELTAQLLDFVHPFAPEVSDPFGVSAALSRALQQGEALRLAGTKLEAAEKLLASLPAAAPAGDAPLLPVQAPSGDPTALWAQLSAVRGELSRASDAAARLLGELHSLGDPSEWEAKRDALAEELDKRQGEYDAINAALEALRAADSQLRERFSPAVNQRAGEYLCALTGGKYDKAALTRQFQALVQEEGAVSPRQDLALSAGAVRQLYLAARLAMCDLALPREEPCPILLDDALDTFDDDRARLALHCLLELARTRQVLLFSCHSREREMLRGTDAGIVTL